MLTAPFCDSPFGDMEFYQIKRIEQADMPITLQVQLAGGAESMRALPVAAPVKIWHCLLVRVRKRGSVGYLSASGARHVTARADKCQRPHLRRHRQCQRCQMLE
jgi:hypothetical protein